MFAGEGNGSPLQYSCLENPMDRGARKAAVHGVARSRTRLSDFSFPFHFNALQKEMASHSLVLAWRIPGTGEPGGLLSMGPHRVGHDWSDLAAAIAVIVCTQAGPSNEAEAISQLRIICWESITFLQNPKKIYYVLSVRFAWGSFRIPTCHRHFKHYWICWVMWTKWQDRLNRSLVLLLKLGSFWSGPQIVSLLGNLVNRLK